MAELTSDQPTTTTPATSVPAHDTSTPSPPTTMPASSVPPDGTTTPSPLPAELERALRARIAELEQVVEARTQTIVGLGARLAELQDDAPPSLAVRLRRSEEELARLRSTKVLRYSVVPRRLYGRLRALLRG